MRLVPLAERDLGWVCAIAFDGEGAMMEGCNGVLKG